MLAAVRQLIKKGKIPSELEAATGRHIFEEIAGNLEGAAFRVELISRHPKSPKIEKRFFTEDDQLFHLNGNTFALTNQWSKDSMEAALAALKVQFGDFGFSIKETA
jgi:hypothetical protein